MGANKQQKSEAAGIGFGCRAGKILFGGLYGQLTHLHSQEPQVQATCAAKHVEWSNQAATTRIASTNKIREMLQSVARHTASTGAGCTPEDKSSGECAAKKKEQQDEKAMKSKQRAHEMELKSNEKRAESVGKQKQ